MLPVLKVAAGMVLPDNDQWQNRFTIKSESSNRLYIVSQHKTNKHWACSCPGWKAHRNCKHLAALQLPPKEEPYPVNLLTF